MIAEARNETVARNDPTAHAELLAMQRALSRRSIPTACRTRRCMSPWSPAPSARAIVLAKVGRVVFGAYDDKAGHGRFGL